MSTSQNCGFDLTVVPAALVGWLLTWLILKGANPGIVCVGVCLTASICAYLINRIQRSANFGGTHLHPLYTLVLLLVSASLLALNATWHFASHQRWRESLSCLSNCALEVQLKRFPTPSQSGYTVAAEVSGVGQVEVLLSGQQLGVYKVNDLLAVSGKITQVGAPPSLGIIKVDTVKFSSYSFAHRNADILRANLAGDGWDEPAALVQAMTLGDLSYLPASIVKQLRGSGIAHLVAISGFHLAIILNALSKVLPGRPRDKILLLLLGIMLIWLAVGAQPSVIRASTMVGLGLFGAVVKRHSQGLNTLAIVVLLWLTYDPWLAQSTGFLLSVAATVAVLGAKIEQQRLENYEFETPQRKFWLAIRPTFQVPVVAHLVTTPIVVTQMGTYPLYGIVLNILVTPLVPLITGGGAFCALLGYLPVPVASLVGRLLHYPASIVLHLVEACSFLPGATLTGGLAWMALGIQYVLVVGGFLISRRVRSFRYGNAK